MFDVIIYTAVYLSPVPQYIPTGPSVDTRRCQLPYWCVHLAYSICVVLTCVSILMVLIYGQAFGMDLSLRWILACFFTVVLSVFIMEPVKVSYLPHSLHNYPSL